MAERGIADADAARLIPHEKVAEEMRLKWRVGCAICRLLAPVAIDIATAWA